MSDQPIISAIQSGYHTVDEISTQLNISNEEIKSMIQLHLDKNNLEKDVTVHGNTRYHLSEDTNSSPKTVSIEGLEVLNKGIDIEDRIPRDAPEFKQADDELDRVFAKIDASKRGGGAVRYIFSGPTACGKSAAAKYIAKERELPVFPIHGKYTLNEADLLAVTTLVNDETKFIYGQLTQAIRLSQEQDVLLWVDEINRIRKDGKGVLMPVLEGNRSEVTIDQRGGEVIRGNPQNLHVIATRNVGASYAVKELDLAEHRRFAEIEFDFLGLYNKDEEVSILTARTEVHEELAELMVVMANRVREAVNENRLDMIREGIPTGLLIDWAETSFAYHDGEINDPILQAARDEIAKPFYGRRQKSYDEIMDIFRSNVSAAPFEKERFQAWADRDIERMISINN